MTAVRQEQDHLLRVRARTRDRARKPRQLAERAFVIPEDVRSISKDVLRHRIGLTYEAEAENVNVEQIINEILRVVNVP